MANDHRILIEEENIISLRTACVMEVDGIASLYISPSPSIFPPPKNMDTVEYSEWLNAHNAYLYQRKPSDSQQQIFGLKHCIFEKLPEFRLLWEDTGNSVAVYLNEKPWAFIDGRTHKTYSKGIMTEGEMNPWYRNIFKAAKAGNPWNQEEFEKTFADELEEY